MTKNSPIKGLLYFSMQTSKGNFFIAIFVGFMMGISLLITGNEILYIFFVLVTILMPPILYMMGTVNSGTTSNWERFRISIPIRRTDVVASNYIGIIVSLLVVGVPILLVFSGLSSLFHSDFRDVIISLAINYFSMFLGMVLFTGALFYPLDIAYGDKAGEAVAIMSMFLGAILALPILLLGVWLGNKVDMIENVPFIIMIPLSVITYFASYAITKKIYSKKDF